MTQPQRPRVWGHRGAMAFAPQNTLPSFLLAVDQGADGVELDVQLTKDGVPVVFHDARVDALTDGRGPIGSLTWTQVQALDAGIKFGRRWKGTKVPTLEEVLAALPGETTVNIELKTAMSESTVWDRWRRSLRGVRPVDEARRAAARAEGNPLAEAVARLVGQGRADQYIISSFDPVALECFLEWLPRIPSSAPIPVGFLHAPSVPWDTPALAAPLPYRAWHPHHSQVTAETVAEAHRAGRKVHVWTVNDPGHAAQLGKLGVDAVITNRPGDVLASLG